MTDLLKLVLGVLAQATDDHSLAPRRISSVLALAIAQPCWQTEGRG
jgi:hypothetical protein